MCRRQTWGVTSWNFVFHPGFIITQCQAFVTVIHSSNDHVACFYYCYRGSMSGMPVHINGFFAVSSNRHQLKWPSIRHTDDSGAKVGVTDKACLWNELVLEEVGRYQSLIS